MALQFNPTGTETWHKAGPNGCRGGHHKGKARKAVQNAIERNNAEQTKINEQWISQNTDTAQKQAQKLDLRQALKAISVIEGDAKKDAAGLARDGNMEHDLAKDAAEDSESSANSAT